MHRSLTTSALSLAAAIMLGCETSDSSTAVKATPTEAKASSTEAQASTVTVVHASPPTPSNAPTKAHESLQKPGFAAYMHKDRLWVFNQNSKDLAEFLASGEPAKSVTRIGAGPGGLTIRSVDADTIDAYIAAQPGFETFIVKGRLWVFRPDDPGLSEFRATGEPAKSVTRIGAGPGGMSIRATDAETIDAYLAAKPGFETFVHKGRLWVFASADTRNLDEFRKSGEPAKSVTRIGAGPGGMSIRAVDTETIDAYLAAKPGFETHLVKGRLWVFRAWDTKHIEDFMKSGEPAKSITRIGAGPGGISIRAVDAETIDAYLAAP